jgi:hypothetical protein
MGDRPDVRVCGYRATAEGTIEAQEFEGTNLPKGWADTPAKLNLSVGDAEALAMMGSRAKPEVAELAPAAELSATVAEKPQPKLRAKRGRKPKAAS